MLLQVFPVLIVNLDTIVKSMRSRESLRRAVAMLLPLIYGITESPITLSGGIPIA
jgi:hypothetical protein